MYTKKRFELTLVKIRKPFFIILFLLSFFQVAIVSAEDISYTVLAPIPGLCGNGNGDCTYPIASNGSSLALYLNNVYKIGIALCVGFAVIMIIWGGMQYLSSDAVGNKEEGKKRIWAAVIGLMIALGSWLILYTLGGDKILNLNLNLKDLNIAAIPLGSRTPEEIALLNSTPQTIPPADPNYTPKLQQGCNPMNVRSTYYYSGEPSSDGWTNKNESSTGTPLRYGDINTVGIVAVDPSLVPYGSIVKVQTDSGPRYFVAADTGGAVKSREASGGKQPVFDFYSKQQIGGQYSNIQVIPAQNGVDYTKLSPAQKEAYFTAAALNKYQQQFATCQ